MPQSPIDGKDVARSEAKTGQFTASDAMDAIRFGVALVGIVLIGIGAWMAWPPAGLMAPGVLLVLLSILAALRGTR